MKPPLLRLSITIGAAFLLWFITFAIPAGNFWLKLSTSAFLLALFGFKPALASRERLFRLTPRSIIVGVLSALLLYAIFWAGRRLSVSLLSFASREIASVYVTKTELNPVAIGLLLFCIMGPAEEIYWRGYVQGSLNSRFGDVNSLFITSAVYALVHIFAFNVMLLVAAGVCGLLWGLLYLREKNLMTVMLSHSLWDVMTFVLFPFS